MDNNQTAQEKIVQLRFLEKLLEDSKGLKPEVVLELIQYMHGKELTRDNLVLAADHARMEWDI